MEESRKLPDQVRRVFRLALRRSRLTHSEMDDELRFHIAARTEQLIARGVPPDEARAQSIRLLGGDLEGVRKRLHDSINTRDERMQRSEWWSDLIQDLRYAARGLGRRPGLTAIIVLTLAIGIGGTTAIFSAIHALMIKPLPFTAPNELMRLTLLSPADGQRPAADALWSWPRYQAFRENQTLFASHALQSSSNLNLRGEEPERLSVETVGANYFTTLRIPIIAGIGFGADLDDHGDQPLQAVLSHEFWQRRFGGEQSAVGSYLDLQGQKYPIIGVAAAGFRGITGRADLFVPITIRPSEELNDAEASYFNLIARRKPEVSSQTAKVGMPALGAMVAAAYPMSGAFPVGGLPLPESPRAGPWSGRARTLNELRVTPAVRLSLYVLFAAAAIVLVIACVNIANLLLGRAAARRREIAVRVALGAGRWRLVRFLLAECLLLAVAGAAASLVVSWWGTRALAAIDPTVALRIQGTGALGVVGLSDTRLGVASLLFSFTIAVVVGILFGLAPALRETRVSLVTALKESAIAARAGMALQRVLVVTEVALAIVLLVGSGLMLKSLGRLLAVDDLGFTARNVVTMQLRLAGGGRARDSLPDMYRQLEERIGALAGVEDVGLRDCAPLSSGCLGGTVRFPERPSAGPARVDTYRATPGWFTTMNVSIRQGRAFNETDRAGAPKVTVVSEAAARAFWPGDSPIGKRLTIGAQQFGEAEVIGVAADVKEQADSAAKPAIYLSYAQSPQNRLMVFVRGAVDPMQLASSIRRAIAEVLPDIPVFDIQRMGTRVVAATAPTRLNATLLALFAGAALALAALGIYGVMAFAVSQRTREIGIRMALGADRGSVLRLVLSEAIALAAIGVVLGGVVALAVTRVLQSYLYEVTVTDPMTYVTIIAVLGGTCVLASWIPARRASVVDPTTALRTEQ